jgi:hypothetical protein
VYIMPQGCWRTTGRCIHGIMEILTIAILVRS